MTVESIRDAIGELVGKTLIELTQHDESYFTEHGYGFVDLMFDSGDVLRIWSMHGDEPFLVLNPDSDRPEDV
jgi:hypothetical protein